MLWAAVALQAALAIAVAAVIAAALVICHISHFFYIVLTSGIPTQKL